MPEEVAVRVRRIEYRPRPKGVEALLNRLLDVWADFYPLPEDDDAYDGRTVAVPAFSVVTVTYRLRGNYNFYIYRIYVDAAFGCTYQWDLNYVLGYDYEGTKTLHGNEHQFIKRLVAKGGSQIVLTITNTSANDYDLDIVLEMWARRVR